MVDLNFGHGGNAHVLANNYGKKIIDFSANINPVGLPKNINKIIADTSEYIPRYPDPDYEDILLKISDYWKIPKECILLGNGSVELIYLIASALKPKKALINVPTFSEYERAVRLWGSEVVYRILREEDAFDLIKKKEIIADMEFICNPNNPTGNLLIRKNSSLLKDSKHMLVVDEAFMDFVSNEGEYSLISEAVNNKNLIVLRTFTKIFAIPGLRIGYLISHRSTISKLKKYIVPWNINIVAQKVVESLLGNSDYIMKTQKTVIDERKFLADGLNKINGLKAFPSTANYLLLKLLKGKMSSTLLREKLLSRGLLVRNCNNFRGLNNRYFRIAVRTRSENKLLLKALENEL
jgi:threonine-phosphate decarboxylase